jgi:DNA polymerase-1
VRVVETTDLAKHLRDAPDDVKLWIYNSFDVLIPHEVREKVGPKMTANQRAIYDFERNLQGPAISMMLNGVLTDQHYLLRVLREWQNKYEEMEKYVNSLTVAVWDETVNVRSPAQMKEFFYYSEDGFQFKPKYTGAGQKRRVTTERKALEQLAKENYYAQPVIHAMLALKDIGKTIEFLERGAEPDGRVHCSFNVAAAESGRWSSSHNPWGRGGNFQNQSEDIRRIYIADSGWVFAYPDLAQAEARGVAYCSGDPAYIKAVESGDVHTQVCKLVWPELQWAGDNGPVDRSIAETIFYRHYTYRDLAKRGSHGSNYGGLAATMAKNLNIPEARAEEFQHRYFAAFVEIRRWHLRVQQLLQSTGKLTTALGRERTFFGRLDSRETLKEALAWEPQSVISEIIKIGLLYTWREFEIEQQKLKCCADMHDGQLYLIKEPYLDEIAPKIIANHTIPVRFPAGVMTIPVDFTVGYRWQKKEMVPWERGVLSKLTRPEPITDLMDFEAKLFVEEAR